MFVTHNPVRQLQRDLADEIDPRDLAPPAAPPKTTISALLRSIGPSFDADMPSLPRSRNLPAPVPVAAPPPVPSPTGRREEWSSLIDTIRESARRMRDVEAEARSRDEQMDDLMRRISADMAEAEARVREAEARLAEVEERAVEQIRTAEARAALAEQRARESEEWLARVQEAIQAEFSGPSGMDR